jgi:hypothetical protein
MSHDGDITTIIEIGHKWAQSHKWMAKRNSGKTVETMDVEALGVLKI